MLFLDFRTLDVGGPVNQSPRLWDGQQLVEHGLEVVVARGKPVVFVLHGYNNSRGEGIDGLEGFAVAAKKHVPALRAMEFVGVLWPGDSRIGFLSFISYPLEVRVADFTARHFVETLKPLRFSHPPRFVAHSLGSRVVLSTLRQLAAAKSNRFHASEVVLMAAAVDDDCLARSDRYLAGVRRVSQLVNVASQEDLVLRYGFRAGDFLSRVFQHWNTNAALGLRGPAVAPRVPHNVLPFQIADAEGVNHGDYLNGRTTKQIRSATLAARALTHALPLVY